MSSTLAYLAIVAAQAIGAYTGPKPVKSVVALAAQTATQYKAGGKRQPWILQFLNWAINHANVEQVQTGVKIDIPPLESTLAAFIAWAKVAPGVIVFGPNDQTGLIPTAGDIVAYSTIGLAGFVELTYDGGGFVNTIEPSSKAANSNPEPEGVYRVHNRLGVADTFIRLAVSPIGVVTAPVAPKVIPSIPAPVAAKPITPAPVKTVIPPTVFHHVAEPAKPVAEPAKPVAPVAKPA